MAKKHPTNELTINLSQQAMDFYQLKQQPFSNQPPDDKCIYSDTNFEQLLDNLKHHLQFSELVLIIEGAQASGKSTLFRHLLKADINNILLLPIQAEITDTLNSLQQKFLPHLKSPHADADISEQLKNLQLFDQTATLVIDDAQRLSDECLTEIFDFQQQLAENAINLKLCFFAEDNTASRLIDISYLQENQLFVQTVPELTNKQIAAFIQHCFSHAGYMNEIDLNRESIIQIEKDSAGNIYQVMQQSIVQIEKHVHKQLTPASRFKTKLLLPAALIIVLAAIFSVMQMMQQNPLATSNTLSGVPEAPVAEVQIQKIQNFQPKPISRKDNLLLNQNKEPSAAELFAVKNKPVLHTPTNNVQKNNLPTMTNNDLVIIPPVKKSPAEKPKTIIVSPKISPTHNNVPVATKSIQKKPATIIQKPQIDLNSPALLALQKLGIKDGTWLKQQNPKHWTLQVLGARTPATLLKFARKHQLAENTAWYASMLKGKPWYVLVHRLYSNRDTARQAVQTLTPELQKTHPWAKSLTSVQKAIKSN